MFREHQRGQYGYSAVGKEQSNGDEVREGWTGDIHRKSLGRALGFMLVR